MGYDAIVVGLGGMGSAALYHLAGRGLRVLGLERFTSPHELGSSHGQTRIIRLAYYEDPSYVPLLRRSYELWRELEAVSGERLLHITGSVDAGPEDSAVFTGSLHSAREHGLAHQVLTSAELRKRFPAYHLPAETMALFQPEGGFLVPERCIAAHLDAAAAAGAEIRQQERVIDWEPSAAGVSVRTEGGAYEAEQIVFTAGAWSAGLLPELAGLAVPERQVLVWFECSDPGLFSPGRFPVFNLVVPEGRYYGLPEFGVPGFKLGRYHHLEERVDPDRLDRTVRSDDEALLRDFAERYFPEGAGRTLSATVCMFTNTGDEHFLIDRHPTLPQVMIAAGFSGHGFKFCSVVGEILAGSVADRATGHDIALFRLDRFAS